MHVEDDRSSLSNWVAPLFELPIRLHPETTAWNGHIPFLFLLFRLMRPRTYVELGVHRGTSFLAACQAAKRFDTGTQCYGIDTWEGDIHAGHYEGEQIYDELLRFTAAHFSRCELIRSTFDEALIRFRENAIDLLHIDGLHTYEAVAHDFQNWMPKLSDCSIVMFHDTAVREGDFGVCRFWSEVKQRYRHLEFQHSHGLGVLFTGQAIPGDMDALLERLHSQHDNAELLQNVAEAAAATLPLRMQQREVASGEANGSFSPQSPAGALMSRNAPCPCGSGKRYKHCHGRIT